MIRSPSFPRLVRAALPVLAALGALAATEACGPTSDRSADADAEGVAEDPASPHPRAAYLTSLTFVGFEAVPSLVHLRFENVADRNRLGLTYQGWVGGPSEWTSILSVEDTIPVARAAWRVVPWGDFRLRVGAAAQIEAVRLPVGGDRLRIEALDAISSWSSSTGQRETLRSAELLLGEAGEAGLLLQRRRARPLEATRAPEAPQAFVLTDTLGDGLIVLRSRTVPDAPATVWAWLDGERIEWSDALMLSLSAPEYSPGRWSVEVARENLVMEIEGSLPVLDTAASSGSSYRLYPVRATLSIGEDRRTLGGIGIEDDGP